MFAQDTRSLSVPSVRSVLTALVWCLAIAGSNSVLAQQHHLVHGEDPPGVAAQKMILSKPELAGHRQLVEFTVPQGTTISIASQGKFSQATTDSLVARLALGSVYRLQIGNLPEELDLPSNTLLYPSIELVDRLYPPAGLEDKFPVEIVFSKEDLALAAKGRMITKVIYLEDPETALPIRQPEGEQSTIDVGFNDDPYRTADRLGRPMAIVRLGSRVPNLTKPQNEFQFNGPAAEILGQHAMPPTSKVALSQPPSVPIVRAMLIPSHFDTSTAFQLPHANEAKIQLANVTGTQEEGSATGPFVDRKVRALDATNIKQPDSIQRTLRNSRPDPERNTGGEFIYDGSDRGRRITVDNDWNIHGLDTEDTIGHFDTLDGRRLVSPSNRVAIYAPRFSAVRRVSNFLRTDFTVGPSSAKQRVPLQLADGKDFSSTTLQNLQPTRAIGRSRASGIRDETRSLIADHRTVLHGANNHLQPYENYDIIRFGRHRSAEGLRLNLGMQSANIWRDDLGLQVHAQNATPIIVNDVYRVQQIETIESKDDNAILRVVKVASRMSGRPGDEIEFTIRYDNLSSREVGNVTIVDNLTGRLEYLEDSAESSRKANFVTESNIEGSLVLRWEITDPVPAGKGGLVRFKCRVR